MKTQAFIGRFNRITWGFVDSTRPRGVIAAGMENGELALWDPSKILAGAGYILPLLFELILTRSQLFRISYPP